MPLLPLALRWLPLAAATSMSDPDAPGASAVMVFPPPIPCGQEADIPTDAWFVLFVPRHSNERFIEVALRSSVIVAGSRRIPLRSELLCDGNQAVITLRADEPLPPGGEVRLDVPGFRDTLRYLGCRSDLFLREAGAPPVSLNASDDPRWEVGTAPAASHEWWTGPPVLRPMHDYGFLPPRLLLTVPLVRGGVHPWLQVDWRGADGEHLRTLASMPDRDLISLEPGGCGGGSVTKGGVYDVTVAVLDDAGRAHEAPGGPLALRLAPYPENWVAVAEATPPLAVAPEVVAPAVEVVAPRSCGCGANGEAGVVLILLGALGVRRRRYRAAISGTITSSGTT
ncbi:MAG: hypothetical protein V4850_26700 [Myxococcota bacterium]